MGFEASLDCSVVAELGVAVGELEAEPAEAGVACLAWPAWLLGFVKPRS